MEKGKQNIRPQRRPLKDVLPLQTPYTVYIDTCGACNFKCLFCPCNTSNYRSKDRHGIMGFELFKKIVNDLSEFPQKIRVVNMYAFGEPLLNPCIVDMIRYLKDQNVCEEIIMVSNGSMLNESLIIGLVNSGLDLFRVSVEGLNSEEYKKFTGRDLSFDELVSKWGMLYQQSRNTPMRIEFKTVNSVINTPQRELLFYELFTPISDYIRVENVGEIWSEFEIDENMKKDVKGELGVADICSRPFFQMAIHSNGEVSACCADWKFKTAYGNANDDKLVDLWNSNRLKRFQIMHANGERNKIEFCNTCRFISPDNISREDGKIIKSNIENSLRNSN